jgi:hypothetical protein
MTARMGISLRREWVDPLLASRPTLPALEVIFEQWVCAQTSGREGVYFREQVFGALGVLSEALPEVQTALGEQNFRFFVREFLSSRQPQDALGTTLIEPFIEFLLAEDAKLARPVGLRRIIPAMPAVASPKPRY